MDCPENTVYHHPQQVCIRESEGKLDDKAITVLRYLEGGRLKKLKDQLQSELADPDSESDTPLLNTVHDAGVVTRELVDDIEEAIEDLKGKGGVEGDGGDNGEVGDDGEDHSEEDPNNPDNNV